MCCERIRSGCSTTSSLADRALLARRTSSPSEYRYARCVLWSASGANRPTVGPFNASAALAGSVYFIEAGSCSARLRSYVVVRHLPPHTLIRVRDARGKIASAVAPCNELPDLHRSLEAGAEPSLGRRRQNSLDHVSPRTVGLDRSVG